MKRPALIIALGAALACAYGLPSDATECEEAAAKCSAQEPACSFDVSPSWFGSAGGEGTIEASDDCEAWEADAEEVEWITFTNDEESGGPTGFTVDPSCEDGERTVILTITEDLGESEGEEFSATVTQSSPITPGDAFTTSAAALYVSNPECQVIYEVTSNGASTITTVFSSEHTQYVGIEYGPDGLLYGSDPMSGLFEIDLAMEDKITAMFDPASARFNSDGDLVVATADGLQALGNQLDLIAQGVSFNPAQISTVANSTSFGAFVDLTTAPNGDLLALAASGSVYRFPYLPASQSYGNGGQLISGFADPRAITRTSTGKIVVADGGTLTRYGADGSSLGTCTSFNGTVTGLEASADDFLYATVVDLDSQGEFAAKEGSPYETAVLFEIAPGCQGPITIASVAGLAGDDPPLAGIAVPFAGQEGEPFSGDFAAGTQAFTFGEQVYEYRGIDDSGAPCEVELKAAEVSAASLDGLLTDSGIEATPIVYEGENARAILFEYTESGDGCTVDGPIVADEHGINAYFAATNPRVVLCHSDQDADNDPFTNPDCELTDSLGSSAFGFLPEDERTSGRGVGRFSWSFLVDKAKFVNGQAVFQGAFCGPKPPLGVTSLDDPLHRDGGSTLPLKFKISTGNCRRGPFVGGQTVVLGINRLPLNGYSFRAVPFEELVFAGQTPAEPDRAVFRSKNPRAGYQLNLKLEYADGTPFEAGAVFELTFTDESGVYFPVETAYVQIDD